MFAVLSIEGILHEVLVDQDLRLLNGSLLVQVITFVG